jgi:hypothetical protein
MKAENAILLTGIAAGLAALLVRRLRSTNNLQDRAEGPFTDLNSASAEDFERIGLSGEVISRIIDNRPYRNKLELVSRMIIPSAVYGDIRHVVGVAEVNEAVKVA